jgi:hypothetical protein
MRIAPSIFMLNLLVIPVLMAQNVAPAQRTEWSNRWMDVYVIILLDTIWAAREVDQRNAILPRTLDQGKVFNCLLIARSTALFVTTGRRHLHYIMIYFIMLSTIEIFSLLFWLINRLPMHPLLYTFRTIPRVIVVVQARLA